MRPHPFGLNRLADRYLELFLVHPPAGMPWEPKQAFGAVASFYAAR